jgi:hypothetical protein
MSCPVNPNARSCDGSAEMTWPILGKLCRRAEAHAFACEGRSNAVSKSCSVVSSVGRTTRLLSTATPWVGDAGAKATDDLDMDDVPESSTGRATGPLSRRPPTHPVPAVLLLFNGLATTNGRYSPPSAAPSGNRIRASSRMAKQTHKAPPGGPGGALGASAYSPFFLLLQDQIRV